MVVYGGDEVSAVVLDVGTQTTRAGYAGEDSPRAVVPTSYGYIEGEAGAEGQYYIGDAAGPSVYRPGQTVHNPVRDGVIEDWSAMERVLEHTIKSQLRLDSLEEHPVLISESTWQSKENRERLLELAFEGWGAPAYYTVDKNVLTAFSVGKGTAMVLDVGEEVSSCMPIYDGFVIRKAIHKSPVGGSLMTNYLASMLKSGVPPIEVRPHYLVKDRIAVPPNTPPRSVLREDRLTGASESYARYAQSQVLHNFKESILQTMEGPYDEHQASLRPQRAFEFPDGYNSTFGTVRYRVPEVMFNPTGILPTEFLNMPAPTAQNSVIPTPSLREAKSVQQLIASSLQLQDPDLHPTLLSNIVVVGGPTLTPGFLDRLQNELMRMPLGNAKPKIEAPGSLVGRKYSSWLGGSILASLGTFHQLWVGREEYMESGKSVINRKTR